MIRVNWILCLATVSIGGLFSASAATVGAVAPDFTLLDPSGESHSLSDFAGKVVVLEWTNYGCPFVQNHYDSGNMQALQAAALENGVVWLSVCSSGPGQQGHLSPEGWREAITRKGVKSAAVLLDESGTVGRAYGATVTPHMFVIDEKGILAYNGAIDSIASTRQSDIAKAENYVRAALEALEAGEPVERSKVRPYGCSIKFARR